MLQVALVLSTPIVIVFWWTCAFSAPADKSSLPGPAGQPFCRAFFARLFARAHTALFSAAGFFNALPTNRFQFLMVTRSGHSSGRLVLWLPSSSSSSSSVPPSWDMASWLPCLGDPRWFSSSTFPKLLHQLHPKPSPKSNLCQRPFSNASKAPRTESAHLPASKPSVTSFQCPGKRFTPQL